MLASRVVRLVSFWLLSLVLFWDPLSKLGALSWRDSQYSYIILIPVVSACFAYIERSAILFRPAYCPVAGGPLLLLGGLVYLAGCISWFGLGDTGRLSVMVFAIVLIWAAGFLLFYGKESFRAAAFPLGLLLMMVPLPAVFLAKVVAALQTGSAEVAYALFRLGQIPVFREGLRFSLPGVDIEVAPECSGIHSTVSLFLASLVAAHLFLNGPGKKICFSLASILVVVLKNGVRIATLSWLGAYVDPAYLHGKLHHDYGGVVFSLLAFAILVPLLVLLRDPGILRNLLSLQLIVKRRAAVSR